YAAKRHTHSDGSERADAQIEALEACGPVTHELARVRSRHTAAHLRSTVVIVLYAIANERDVHIAAGQSVPFVVDEIAYGDADLAHRIRRPDDQLGIQPFAFPSGRFPQLGLLWQIRNLASEVRPIRGGERNIQPVQPLRPALVV